MQNLEIILLIFATFFLIAFNTWYTAYKFSKQTKETVAEFDFQIRRRINLIGDLLKEIGKYTKAKKPFEEEFSNIVKKASSLSMADIGETIFKETDNILKSAIKFAEKYPGLISSAKFKSIRGELNKLDDAIASAYDAYGKNSCIVKDWMKKFPFSLIKERFFNIDKDNKKTESKEASEEEKKQVSEEELDSFAELFKEKKAKPKTKKASPKKIVKKETESKNNKKIK